MKIIAKLALAALAGVALGASPAAAQKITFTLNWVAGGDHAPYFYAQKMGLYKQAGLDVDFETGRGSAASAQKVGAGQSQLGLSDMAGVLLFRGKGADNVGLMNVYANSPQGFYWLKSSGITGVKDLAGKKIGNPAGDGARTMWPALAKKVGIDPDSVTWVNIDANAKLSALKAKTIDATTSFFNLHHMFARELGSRHGLPGLEGRRRESVRQLDHRQRRLAQGQPRQGRQVREGHAEGVRRLRQDAGPLHQGAGRGGRRAAVRQRAASTGTSSPS